MILIEIPNFYCFKCHDLYRSWIQDELIFFEHPKLGFMSNCIDELKRFERPINDFLVSVFNDKT